MSPRRKQAGQGDVRPDDQEPDPTGPRPFWSGTITFGLVSIPVNLYPAVRHRGVRLRMLAADGAPLRRRYVCPAHERDIEPEHLVRGHESDDGTYVIVTDEELEAVSPRKSRDIDLRRFVATEALDPFLFERAHILTPSGDTEKPYRLLADVMEHERKAGIATFVMRNKEYLVAIFAERGILRAETLRFADETRTPSDIGLPEPRRAAAMTVKRFEKAVRKLEKRDLDRNEMSDERSEKLRALIARKRDQGEGVIQSPTREPQDSEAEEDGASEDLVETIRRSLLGTRAPARRRTRSVRHPPARRGTPHARLRGLSKGELYARARERSIPGRASMTKEQLIRALERTR